MEGVNDVNVNQATIHTRTGCLIPENSVSASTGRPINGFNCDVDATGNAGCGYQVRSLSYDRRLWLNVHVALVRVLRHSMGPTTARHSTKTKVVSTQRYGTKMPSLYGSLPAETFPGISTAGNRCHKVGVSRLRGGQEPPAARWTSSRIIARECPLRC